MTERAAAATGDGRPDPTDPTLADVLASMVALAVVGADGDLSYVSDRWCEVTGWPRERALGTFWSEVLEAGDRPAAAAARELAAETAEPQGFEARIAAVDGAPTTWIKARAVPLGATDGRDGRWLLVANDITEPKMAAIALEQSERRLQAIFDSSTDIISIFEPDGTWRSATTSASRLLGNGERNFNEHPMSAIHPEDQKTVAEAFSELSRQTDGKPGPVFEFRVRAADGREVWLETIGVNLTDDPAVGGIVLHSRDVTERHRAAGELSSTASRLRSLVSNLFVGVVMADEDNRIIFVNQAATRLFGLGIAPEDMAGRSVGDRGDDFRRLFADHEAELDRIDEIVAQRKLVMEERVVFANGRVVARSFVPIFDDGVYRGHMWLFRDLTAELAVAAQREHLLEVEKEQNARLMELDVLKTELMASVSHELRTPLTSIVSFTTLLKDGLETDSRDDQAEFLDIIRRNTERLLRLVDDLLLLDRLESNTLVLSHGAVDLPALVEEAVLSIRPVAEAKGVTVDFTTQPGPPLWGDIHRLGQLIDNLLSNAVKFTPADGRVRVDVTPEGEGWQLTVSDTGIGIPTDELGELFQRFYRASNARKEAASGSGLGLAIALRIAELHGGTIKVESREGRGTTVGVTLFNAPDPAHDVSPLASAES